MNFKYPISKDDGKDYSAEELYAILSKEKSGHYLLGNHQFWHGGIHFSTETVKQCVLKQPIRCIADGEVIAYRINQKYQSSKLNNTIFKYSSSFCLVKHEYESPAEPIKTPEKDPTKLNEEWQNKKIEILATGFVSHSDEAYSNDKKLMPKGLKLEILHVNDTTKKISNTEYYLAKAKVLEAVEANTADKTSAYNKDEELWFAAFKKDGSLQSSVSQKTELFKQTDSTDATTEDKKESEEATKLPKAKTNKLTFYSLYMHLLPYDEYPVQEEEIKQQAKIIASNLRARDKIIGDENAQVIGKISKGTIVNILSVSEDKSGNNYCAKVTIFNNSGKITSINETTKKEEQVTPPADGFWIVLKDKQTNNGKITWREYARELPVPKREYPKYWAKQVTAKVIAKELNVRQAPGAGNDIAGEPLGVKLKKDDEVTYNNSKIKALKINGKAYQMAECKLIKDKEEFTEKGITSFWACIESKFMTVIKAEPDTFDTIDTTNMKISAGEPIGYLGLYEVPNSATGGKSDNPKKQVHIEVFTVASEEELKKFLDNEAGLTIGRQYIKIPKDTVLDKQEAEANGTSDVALNSTWQNKEIKILANGFASYASEGLGATGKKRMPKGLKLKILQVKDTTNKIGKSNYYVAKAKVLEDIKADIADTNDYKKDEEIWFAAFTANKKIMYSTQQKTNLFEDVTVKPDNTVFSPDIQKLQNTYYKTQYDHIVSPDMAKLVNDKYTVTIYENKQSVTGCVAQDKIEKISQYNLTELGFKIIKEENANADGNVSTSKDGFIDQEKMTPFFQDLCKEIDSKENGGDGDGKLSLSELRNALKDPALSEKWSKLIAYHPTEWQAKGDDAKWNRLVTDILSAETDRALLNHEKERITNLVFWDDVPDLKGKKAAFHFHPVAFLEHLYADNTNQRNICKICGKSLKLEPDFLKIIAPDAEEDFINAFSKLSKKLFPKYGIDTCDQIWHLLAQSKVETQLFVKFRENLNYTAKSYTAEKLYSMCKTVIDNGFTRLGMGNLTKEERIDYVGKNLLGNDAAFGAHCYGNDKFPGKDYRGRGLIHLTHFDAYEKCAKAIGYQIDAQPELAETDYHVIVETGLWYWKEHDIAILANNRSVSDDQAVTAVTKKINAGLKNLSDRIKFKKEIMDEYIKKYGSCTPNGKVSDLIKILEENCEYENKKGWSGYNWATAIRAGRSCSDKLSTKESNTPLGRCYAYVKIALWCSNMVDHYLIGIAAKDAGSELENQGYTNLQSDPKTKLTDIKKAPVGAVIVYSGGKYGHIEVWTGTHFISDYKTSLARTEKDTDKGVAPLTGRDRTCIGIWIK